MKKRDLINAIKKLGAYLVREGGDHEVWSNGEIIEAVPRHNEINENLAKKIIRRFEKGN